VERTGADGRGRDEGACHRGLPEGSAGEYGALAIWWLTLIEIPTVGWGREILTDDLRDWANIVIEDEVERFESAERRCVAGQI